jgi:hypothetical protein
MKSKRPNRRGFLKGGAALAGLAAGNVKLAEGHTQGTPAKKIDEVMDAQSLPKVKTPNQAGFALPPEWKHGEPRLQGYP